MSHTPYMDAVRELERKCITREQFMAIIQRGVDSAFRMRVMNEVWWSAWKRREDKRRARKVRMARKRRRGWA